MLIWLTGADGWMRYWTVSGQGSSVGAEFVIRRTLLGLPLAQVLAPREEGVWQIQVGVVSLVSPGLTVMCSRGQVTTQTPGVAMAMVEAEQTVVRVQARHQAGIQRGWEVTSGEARPLASKRSRRCGGGSEG